jgi:hypothetical protein
MTNFAKRALGGISCLFMIGMLVQACTNGDDGAEQSSDGLSALPGHGHLSNLFNGHGLRGRHVFNGRGPCGGSRGDGGGAAGSGGMGGSGGGGGGSRLPPACVGSSPAVAAITGSALSPSNATFTYHAPPLAPPVISPITTPDGVVQGLNVTASPGATTDPANAWSGFGFAFTAPACLDASAYTGIKFTIAGDLGTCRLSFEAIPSEDSAVVNNGSGLAVNTCTAASCITPSLGPILPGTTVVHFADLSGGVPLPTVDPKALVGVGWQLDAPTDGSPPCSASFTVTDVSFINDSPPKACTGVSPATPVIATFADAVPSPVAVGNFDLPSIGGTYTYSSDGVSKPTLSLPSTNGRPSGQALGVSVATGLPPATAQYAWSGAGIFFNSCTDASRYSGVRFSIKGNVGSCPLYFSTTFSEDDAVESNPNHGSCVSAANACYPPWSQPVNAGTTTVKFSEMTSGSPVSGVNPKDLTGIHWEYRPPTDATGGGASSCSANFTIDDVAFVR